MEQQAGLAVAGVDITLDADDGGDIRLARRGPDTIVAPVEHRFTGAGWRTVGLGREP